MTADETHDTADLSDLDLGQPKVKPICDELGVSEELRDAAIAQARRADFEYPVNVGGDAIAAASVYFQALLHNEKRTQAEVSAAADVSEVTIRRVYRDIAREEGFDIEPARMQRTRDSPDDTSVFGRLREVFRIA